MNNLSAWIILCDQSSTKQRNDLQFLSSSILFKEYRITSAVLLTSVSKGWVFGLFRPLGHILRNKLQVIQEIFPNIESVNNIFSTESVLPSREEDPSRTVIWISAHRLKCSSKISQARVLNAALRSRWRRIAHLSESSVSNRLLDTLSKEGWLCA